MNASELWSGTEYAWAEYRPRGKFPMNAVKVRLIKVTKERRYGNNNASTYAEVDVLSGHREGRKIQVRARDIVDFWDAYEDEKEHREEERKKEQARLEQLRKEQEERFAAQRAAREAQVKLIAEKLQEKGIPEACIYSIGEHSITLKTPEVRIWLEIPTV